MQKVVKDLIVTAVGELAPSKQEEYPYIFVAMKSVEAEDKGKYRLNLSQRSMKQFNRWLPNIVKGNVLRCVMQEKNGLCVDQSFEFEVIKSVKKVEDKAYTKPTDSAQLSIGLYLDKIDEYADKIKAEVRTIRSDFADKL